MPMPPELLVRTLPITVVLALGFYLAVAAMAVSRRLRGWVVAHVSMPVPSSQVHLAPLDALRGLSAIYVALFHAWQWYPPYTGDIPEWLQHGPKAVAVFVVLSGFLIYRAAAPIASRDDLTRYVRNRFLRIYPLYCVATLAIAVCGAVGDVKSPAQQLLSDLLMLRGVGAPVMSNPPVWSLYVEVLFYLVMPCAVIVFARRPILAAVVGLVAVSYADLLGPREVMLWKYFLIGILASGLHTRLAGRLPVWAAVAVFAAGWGLLAIDVQWGCDWVALALRPYVWWPEYALPDVRAEFTVGLAIAILCVVTGSALWPGLGRFCHLAPWRMLAAISYSVFVWHGLLILADRPLLFTAAGSLMPSGGSHWPGVLPWWGLPCIYLPAFCFAGAVSFVAIERPFLMLRRTRR